MATNRSTVRLSAPRSIIFDTAFTTLAFAMICSVAVDAWACLIDDFTYCGRTTMTSTVGAPNRIEGYACGGPGGSGAERVFVFHTQQTGTVLVRLDGMNTDHDVYVLEGRCDPSQCIAFGTVASTTAEEVSFTAQEGVPYFIVVEAVTNPEEFTVKVAVDGLGGCRENCSLGIDADGDMDIGCNDADCRFDPFCNPRLCDTEGQIDCSSDLLASSVGASAGLSWYPCGNPYAGLQQAGSERVYAFTPQADGDVSVILDGMTTDHDLYVLASFCDPLACVAGATNSSTQTESLTFSATAGQTYYLVVEEGGGEGQYQLDFGVGGGCREDCDNGLDDDFDSAVDCADPDCAADLPCVLIFRDEFETGGAGAWDVVVDGF